MQNGAEEKDIKVLPQEGVSVEIGGETYNPAFLRFSCQIIIFSSDYDWEQIVFEASSQTNGKKDSSSAHLLLMAIHFIQLVFQD